MAHGATIAVYHGLVSRPRREKKEGQVDRPAYVAHGATIAVYHGLVSRPQRERKGGLERERERERRGSKGLPEKTLRERIIGRRGEEGREREPLYHMALSHWAILNIYLKF